MKPSSYDISKLSMRILYLGLFINVVGSVIIFFGGMYLADNVFTGTETSSDIKIFGYVLIGLAVVEIAMIIYLKRVFLNPDNIRKNNPRTFVKFAGQIKIYYLILYFIALGPAIYGLLYYLMGGTQDLFVLMVCVTLIGYMLIRPKPSYIEKIAEPFDFEEI